MVCVLCESPLFGSMMLLLVPLIIWSLVWKGYGLWRAGKNNQLGWFIAMLILNTAGILPIIYIALFQKKKARRIEVRGPKKRKR